VHTAADIETAHQQNKVGIIFGFQNCSPIEDDIDLVEIFHQLGVRIMQLTYNNQSLLASGCYEPTDTGISRFGKVVIAEMNRVGMVVDMSHSAEESTMQAIALSQRPIVISHANPSFFEPAKRNKSNRVLSALAESGGLLGFSLYPFHLQGGPDCTLDSFCNMVADTVDLMGIDHVGMGSDLCLNQPLSILEWMRNGRWSKQMDYGEGSATNAAWPKSLSWFENSADFPNIVAGLQQKGFNATEVEKIMGGNWLALCRSGFGPQSGLD
jgi:membrane dipeptidase